MTEDDNICSFDDSDGTSIWKDKADFKDNTFLYRAWFTVVGGSPGKQIMETIISKKQNYITTFIFWFLFLITTNIN
jgi:hypothetical protein